MEIGPTGIWSAPLRYGDPGERRDAAAELEALGYDVLWLPGGIGGDIFGDCATLLDATARIAVATGIVNVWMHDAAECAAAHARLTDAHPARFLLGLGISHAPLIDAGAPGRYSQPVATMRRYLDELDAADPAVPVAERALAALGPQMLALARDRTWGAHPYHAPPEHTQRARAVLGPGALLAPEQLVVLDTDPTTARATARAQLAIYLSLPNYVNNWKRLGFGADDTENGGSDRLIDAIVAWGDEEAIAARVGAHRSAGADHVCIQVGTDDPQGLPREAWRRLAPALTG